MKLKHTDSSGEIVLTMKVILGKLFVLKNVNIELENKSYKEYS